MSPLGRCCRKSLLGVIANEKFLKLLMRFVRSEVRDHIVSQKNDYGPSYRQCGAPQRRSRPKIAICEIFGVIRFSTFSTASAPRNRTCEHNEPALPRTADLSADVAGRLCRGMKRLMHHSKRTLFDHLVGTDQNGIRDRQAQQLCRPGIDYQFVDGGLLDGNVSGLGTL